MKIAYIGSPDSFFTKLFLKKLFQINPDQLLFICVLQALRKPKIAKPDLILRLALALKDLQHFFIEKISLLAYIIYCKWNHIPILVTSDVNSEKVCNAISNFDFVLSAGLNLKMNNTILNAPRNGIINFHYSLLPKFKGTRAVFWQLVDNDFNFGYTFHKMNSRWDQGEIVFQQKADISVHEKVSKICDELTIHAAEHLSDWIHSNIIGKSQNLNEGTIHSEADFWKYIKIDFDDPTSVWIEKSKYAPFLLLNGKFIAHVQCRKMNSVRQNGIYINNLRILIAMDQIELIIKNINYLPALFYYYKITKLVRSYQTGKTCSH